MCFPDFSSRHLGHQFDPIWKSFTPSDSLVDTLNIVPTRKFSNRNNEGARDADVFPAFSSRHLSHYFDPIRKSFTPSDSVLDPLNIVPT